MSDKKEDVKETSVKRDATVKVPLTTVVYKFGSIGNTETKKDK